MLISHQHKFIFMHCRKTAGSSVTVALSKLLGDDDVQIGCITDGMKSGVRPPKSVIRGALTHPHIVPASFLVLKLSFWEYVNKWSKHRYRKELGHKATHATAERVKAAFPEEWSSYYKFCAIRNPWDKTVSDYFWRTRGKPGAPSFARYVAALENGYRLNGIIPEPHSNWGIYTIDDQVAVDQVIKYESLQDDLAGILKDLGINWDGWVPHSKNQYKTAERRPKDYRTMYSAREIETVGRLYAKEVVLGGYKFEP